MRTAVAFAALLLVSLAPSSAQVPSATFEPSANVTAAPAAEPTLADLLGPAFKPTDKICRWVCDYTWPVVTVNYTGVGATCQAAQAHLDGQIGSYATGFCAPENPCGVYTVIQQNCFYNSTTRQYQMGGYGTFSCFEWTCGPVGGP